MKAIRTCKFRVGCKEKLVCLIKAGEKRANVGKNIPNMLLTVPNWKLFTDLRRQLIFPNHIAQTTLQPDLIIFSKNIKKIIIWELSVSWEDNIILANERKREKYQEFVEECQQNSWKTYYDPIEVGCWGFVGHSWSRAQAKIGIVGCPKKKALNERFMVVEWASRLT